MLHLNSEEKILRVLRRHPVVMLPTFLATLFLALAPWLIRFLIQSGFFLPASLIVDQSFLLNLENWLRGVWLFGYSVWLTLLWVFVFIEWTNYYLDLWVITDKQILDIEQMHFFYRDVTSFSYNQIQDITVETRGLIETFFKFGTLHIQTAGHNREIIIKNAIRPEEARSLILQLQEQARIVR